MRARALCLLYVLMSVNCFAGEVKYTCPDQITVVASIPSPPPGWNVLNKDVESGTKHFLEYAVFTDGHPRNLAYLRPNNEQEIDLGKKKAVRSIFVFKSVSPDGMYLVCGYARTTRILFKPIETVHTHCEVVRSVEDQLIQSIKCK